MRRYKLFDKSLEWKSLFQLLIKILKYMQNLLQFTALHFVHLYMKANDKKSFIQIG